MFKNFCFKFFIGSLVLLLFSCSSQKKIIENSNKEIEVIANQMFIDMNNKDFDAILDMTYPKVYDYASKEQMKSLIKSIFQGNDEILVEISKDIPAYKITDIVKKDSINYAFVSYDLKMKMTFKKEDFDEDSKKMMKSIMKSKGMNVNFVSNNSMDVLMEDRITILIKDHLTNNKWKMLNYDPDSPLFYQMTPSVLIEAGKKYKQDLMLSRKKNN